MLKKSMLFLVLALCAAGLAEAKTQKTTQSGKASKNNCFCTCNCGFRSSYTEDGEKPFYSEEGVEVKTDSGEVKRIHNFCDKKFYLRAKNGLCSVNE